MGQKLLILSFQEEITEVPAECFVQIMIRTYSYPCLFYFLTRQNKVVEFLMNEQLKVVH